MQRSAVALLVCLLLASTACHARVHEGLFASAVQLPHAPHSGVPTHLEELVKQRKSGETVYTSSVDVPSQTPSAYAAYPGYHSYGYSYPAYPVYYGYSA